jgi:hypothetical protein
MPRTAQQTLTNPVGGTIANVPLQGSQGGAGLMKSESKDEILSTLDKLSNSNQKPSESDLQIINKSITSNSLKDYSDDLRTLAGALQNNTGGVATKDPITGEAYPNGAELASQLAKRIREDAMERKSETTFNLSKFAQKVREDRNKKKTRGNPFRVLMGKIGKLLDHGLGKRDIVRYIGKENIWDDDTIDKAVDVVMEYNKKKRSREKKFQKESSSVYNLKTAARDADKSIYEFEPDFAKRSTGELMARASWLNDLMNYSEKTPQGDSRKAANKDGVNAELKAIRAALKSRGFEPNEIP